MASSQASVFGLKDFSLVKTQGFIDGKWVNAKSGEKITVQSAVYAVSEWIRVDSFRSRNS
jgi:hypothetical protein